MRHRGTFLTNHKTSRILQPERTLNNTSNLEQHYIQFPSDPEEMTHFRHEAYKLLWTNTLAAQLNIGVLLVLFLVNFNPNSCFFFFFFLPDFTKKESISN